VALAGLLAAREAAYKTADIVVDTELLTPQQVAKQIVALVRSGWPR
jgi:predicted DNA repair protein MutK